jgi:aspartate kinase
MMSFGERCSSRVVAAALTGAGLPAEAAMSYDLGLLTDSRYGAAQVLEESYGRLAESLGEMVRAGVVPVVTGFIAKDANGFITTLGRSGSDYTAAIVGRALAAEEIEIWTDVDGVMSADPRIVPEARSLATMSFSEAAELAYYGAEVIHPATIQPAVKANVPIRVLNTYKPGCAGTVILRDSKADRPGARSIASKGDISLVHVQSLRMLLLPGFMARLFAVFERHGVVIDMISTSEVSVTLTTDSGNDVGAVVAELAEFAEVRVEREKAILCLVGAGLRDDPRLLARVFDVLSREGISARMVSVGASQINVSLLVDMGDEGPAVRALHREFFSI